MIKKICIIAAAVLALAAGYYFYTTSAPSFEEAAKTVENPYAASITAQDGKLRDTLEDDNKQLYDIVKAALIGRDAEIVIKRDVYEPEDLVAVRNSIFYDSPELFWVDFSSLYFRDVDDGFVIIPTYFFEAGELEAKQITFNTACEKLVAETKAAYPSDEFDQIRYVHDYLTTNVDYNAAANEGTIHTAYGALVDLSCVCDGYAHAFQYIMGLLGIDCDFVQGTAVNTSGESVAHAWNAVKAGGEYYFIDVTWDRPGLSKAQSRGYQIISHAYFLVDGAYLAKTHTAEAVFAIPECNQNYGYFKKLGLEGESISDIKDTFENAVFTAATDGPRYFEFVLTGAEVESQLSDSDFIEDLVTDINKRLKSGGFTARIANVPILYEADTGRCFAIVTFN